MAKRRRILVDFDETVEGKTGKNKALIEALKKEQANGAIILGFTNWFSYNYGGQGSGAARSTICQELEDMGLKFDAVVTTNSDLEVARELANGNPDKKSELELLGQLYNDLYKKQEQSGSANSEINAATQLYEKQLTDYKDYAEKTMKVGTFLRDDLGAISTGTKENMMRLVVHLLGKDNEYVLFDDKADVCNTAERLRSEEGIDITGVMVTRMKPSPQNEPLSYDSILKHPRDYKEVHLLNRGVQNYTDKAMREGGALYKSSIEHLLTERDEKMLKTMSLNGQALEAQKLELASKHVDPIAKKWLDVLSMANAATTKLFDRPSSSSIKYAEGILTQLNQLMDAKPTDRDQALNKIGLGLASIETYNRSLEDAVTSARSYTAEIAKIQKMDEPKPAEITNRFKAALDNVREKSENKVNAGPSAP